MQNSYQDMFLKQVQSENMSVTMHLNNGFQIRGIVRGFDNYVIIVESEGKQQMVYKHAVSTVVPLRSLDNLFGIDKKPETEEE